VPAPRGAEARRLPRALTSGSPTPLVKATSEDPSPMGTPSLKDLVSTTTVPFAVSYELSQLPKAEIVYPGYSVTVKLSGRVSIQLAEQVSLRYITNKGLEVALRSRTDHILGQLVSETKAVYNPTTGAVTFTNRMISESRFAGAPKSAIGIVLDSSNPIPALQAEIEYPEITGRVSGNLFVAQRLKITIEVRPDPRARLQEARRISAPAPSFDAILVIAGFALLTGTIIADFLTAGGSIADDPATVAAATSMIAAGLGLSTPEPSGRRPVQQQL